VKVLKEKLRIPLYFGYLLQPLVAKSGDYFISHQNLTNEGPFFSQKSISGCQNHNFQVEKN
jgi:hypothetical protein